jgi:hypothetical protein
MGIIVLALLLGGITAYYPRGLWPSMLQFALGGWPDKAEELPPYILFWGAFIQTISHLGLPILIVTIIYRVLTRRPTMRIANYIARRDEFIVSKIYAALRELGRGESPVLPEEDYLIKARQVMEDIQAQWDKKLPEDTEESLTHDEVRIIGEEQQRIRYGK